jgi:parallel beta-helix repeat protein
MRQMILAAAVLLGSCAQQDPGFLAAGPDLQKRALEKLIAAKPGMTITFPAGRFEFDTQLSITTDNITVRGQGMDKTILSFKGQKTGASGFLASGNGFTIEDLTVQDPKGDGVKVNGADGVVMRRVKAEWTGGTLPTNGPYGLYPVRCKNVLIEDSVAIGSSDAGIYVGQSSQIVVRRNRAERNVAGIEIENSTFSDVYENVAVDNTAGMLVFNLPNVPVQGGKHSRVYRNRLANNNTPNFGPPGHIVGNLPAGSGLIVLATSQADVYDNDIGGHDSFNIAVVSFLSNGIPLKDKSYYPYPDSIYIHDNRLGAAGGKPDKQIAALQPALGLPIPSILWDGMVDPKHGKALPPDKRICIVNNAGATFANYDFAGGARNISRDLKPHDCHRPPLAPVELSLSQGSAARAGL